MEETESSPVKVTSGYESDPQQLQGHHGFAGRGDDHGDGELSDIDTFPEADFWVS